MNKRMVTFGAAAVAAVALFVGTNGQQDLIAQTKKGLPMFEVDPKFPQMPPGLVHGAVSGVAADRNGNVWVFQRPHTVPEYNETLNGYKPAPPVMQFDAKGKYLQGWGGYSTTKEYDWFYREGEMRSGYVECPGCGTEVRGNGDNRAANGEHGIFVDDQDNVWLTGNASRDGQILKFTKDGKFLKEIGKVVPPGSVDSADTTRFARAAGVTVNTKTNEAYISDGYGNRRVVVIDATTGAYKRHWGAYGNVPDDKMKGGRVLTGPGNPQFNTVHGIAISSDGTVFVADRANNRVQVFTPEGKFLREGYNVRDSKGTGSVFGVVISPDDKWLYIADASHGHVAIMDPTSMEVVGSVGRPGRAAGEFSNLHSLAVDRQGNLLTGESQGYRVQKFIYKGLSN